ncbi:hypothetical protein [Comamonas squillarum]|uniref:Uncharacterized protein n=1 Tax=Comamonas squillarum TaxID=2977320 RepID=A0ABY6A2A1_9BURK|nr:hypothetical protein [Comamonas sp. PR12]UXC18839.1 hypothetical protein N4T19_01500 [Comamonas sp. PR12]
MDLNTFESRATRATESMFSFAAFVAAAEDLSTDPRYADAWLDAEIVNALALAAWEEQGRLNGLRSGSRPSGRMPSKTWPH